MICPPCKEAGFALRATGPGDRLAEAVLLHRQCEDPVTCPCRHEVLPVDAVISGRKDG